ncbi:MAG: hypothetical protein ABI596_16795 [Pyrinomonadaceae bacterium]
MKRIIALAIAGLMMSPVIAFPQTRARTTNKRRPRATTTRKSADQVRTEGATRVADQIKILTRFIYLLGGVTKGIEAADEAARRHEASPAVIAQTENNKATVKTSLENVRDGLDKLELDFRTTPGLQRYYPDLVGVAAAAATAEEQAARNQFDQAGRTLLGVVNHLTDVLLHMR